MLTAGIRTSGGCLSGSRISQRTPNLQILGAQKRILKAYKEGAAFGDAQYKTQVYVQKPPSGTKLNTLLCSPYPHSAQQ